MSNSKPARVRTQTLPHLALTTHRVPHGGESEAGEAPTTFAEPSSELVSLESK